jgi:Holliday junction resolvasome RuvABC DNA-binding subunit
MFVVGMYEVNQKANRLRRAVTEQRQRISKLHALGYPTRYAEHALETMLKTLRVVEAQQSLLPAASAQQEPQNAKSA